MLQNQTLSRAEVKGMTFLQEVMVSTSFHEGGLRARQCLVGAVLTVSTLYV